MIIWSRLSVPTTATKAAPAIENVEAQSGHVGKIIIVMPATVAAGDMGIRVVSAGQRLLPATANAADWIYSDVALFVIDWQTNLEIDGGPPFKMAVEAFNTGAASREVQVGFWLDPDPRALSRMEANTKALTAAIDRLTNAIISG